MNDRSSKTKGDDEEVAVTGRERGGEGRQLTRCTGKIIFALVRRVNLCHGRE